MIKKEFYSTRKDGINLYRTYSTENLYVQKVGTDEIDEEFVDIENAPYEYTEINKKIIKD